MLTTITFLSFRQNKAKAFAAMGLLPRRLQNTEGLSFSKMMGSGRGKAFSMMPDFSRYCLLAAWEQPRYAEAFFAANSYWVGYSKLAAGTLHFQLEPLSAKGSWNGQQPFIHQNERPLPEAPVAVLTRASLRWNRLPSFWRNAGDATADLPEAKGLCYSVGIGEVPYLEQATFSVWETAGQMMQFVSAPAHLQAIKLRHRENWYREELFARFRLTGVHSNRPELFPEYTALQQLAG